jgi:hypothetical protein
MQSGTYVIFLGTGSGTNRYCLGVRVTDGRPNCVVVDYDPNSSAATWLASPTSEPNGLYLEHLDTNKAVHFGDSKAIYLDEIDPNDMEFFITLNNTGDGQVAINNHDASYVMDANGNNAGPGAPVTPRKWNGGNNQKWRFISTDILDQAER